MEEFLDFQGLDKAQQQKLLETIGVWRRGEPHVWLWGPPCSGKTTFVKEMTSIRNQVDKTAATTGRRHEVSSFEVTSAWFFYRVAGVGGTLVVCDYASNEERDAALKRLCEATMSGEPVAIARPARASLELPLRVPVIVMSSQPPPESVSTYFHTFHFPRRLIRPYDYDCRILRRLEKAAAAEANKEN